MRPLTCCLLDDEKGPRERMAVLLGKFENIKILGIDEKPEEAISNILCKKPDLVFIDVEMPRMSGFDVIREIRNNNFFPDFIFVTGYNQYAIKAIKEEAFDFLLKPVDIDELKETIDRYHLRLQEKISHGKVIATDLPYFTEREIEIIRLIVGCKSAKEISEILHISKNTVDTHRKNILEKAGLHKISELIVFARESGLDKLH
ncbi:MAG: response regulator transcription factor [Bacteroidetes bacterium]|nr:response regulator transcription factor [Bacteroidota bacterium]